MYITPAEWLATLTDEYLSSFVPSGGAAVKCAVTPDPHLALEVRRQLEAAAHLHGFHTAFVDAATTRIHMIDAIVHSVARQIDWDTLSYTFMRGLLESDGFRMPLEISRFTYAGIAETNSEDEAELRRRVRVLLRDRVSSDYAMTSEFRIAMLRLCQARLEAGGGEQLEAEAITSWLRGELRLLSALKPARIFQKIGRHNARDLLLSLIYWLRLTGKSGLVLTLDIARYLVDRRTFAPDGGLFHSMAATLDAYEVLRQFIDATDEMEGCLIVVLAPTAFLTDERRGLAKYGALKLRVWDEVHDRRRANPLSGLVRLREAPTEPIGQENLYAS